MKARVEAEQAHKRALVRYETAPLEAGQRAVRRDAVLRAQLRRTPPTTRCRGPSRVPAWASSPGRPGAARSPSWWVPGSRVVPEVSQVHHVLGASLATRRFSSEHYAPPSAQAGRKMSAYSHAFGLFMHLTARLGPCCLVQHREILSTHAQGAGQSTCARTCVLKQPTWPVLLWAGVRVAAGHAGQPPAAVPGRGRLG